jgi:hypothetical protein
VPNQCGDLLSAIDQPLDEGILPTDRLRKRKVKKLLMVIKI